MRLQRVPNGPKNLLTGTILMVSLMFGISVSTDAQESGSFILSDRGAPVGANAREPSLATLRDDRVALSWTEDQEGAAEVRMAILDGDTWSDAKTVHRSSELYINWSDFPSVVALADGRLAAHWLELNGTGDYDYDVRIAFSGELDGAPHPARRPIAGPAWFRLFGAGRNGWPLRALAGRSEL